MGSTDVGIATNKSAITMAKTANTNQTNNTTKMRNSTRTRPLIIPAEISAILLPFSFTLMTRAPKSWTVPIKTVPNTTHSIAGSQPQYAATHGPMIGAAPAIEVKWCPKRICFLVGKKSMSSRNSWAGVLKSSSRP